MATRQQAAKLWHDKMKRARGRYEDAAAKAHALFLKVQHRALPNPDDVQALHEAHEEESAALREFMRAFRVLTRLTMQGRVPPEE